jgi:hypothetical protein
MRARVTAKSVQTVTDDKQLNNLTLQNRTEHKSKWRIAIPTRKAMRYPVSSSSTRQCAEELYIIFQPD